VKYVQIYDTVDITTNGSVAGAGHGSMAKLFLRRAIAGSHWDIEFVHR